LKKSGVRQRRLDRDVHRDLVSSLTVDYLAFVASDPGIETRDAVRCEAAARRFLSAAFYRIVRKELREKRRTPTLSVVLPLVRPGRFADDAFVDGRAEDPSKVAAGREVLELLRKELNAEEQAILEGCLQERCWTRTGRINLSEVSRVLGVPRPRVRLVFRRVMQRLSDWGYGS
jgi:hypothetical protein